LLLAEIAAGLARVVATEPAPDAGAELLLETSSYAAWRVVWRAGDGWCAEDRAPGALHVVRGEVVEQWTDLRHLDTSVRVAGPGDTIALGGSLTARLENRGGLPALLVLVTTRTSAPAWPCDEPLRLAG
jgi:hypothetical protein